MNRELEAWESEGGASNGPLLSPSVQMSGTPNQVQWAQQIKRNVNAEFDRVASSFRSVAEKQSAGKRADTEAIIAILEEKRAAVMGKEQAGYFIHDWQEISGQVRQMISDDPRFKQIKALRKAS
jgi:hypothetical protein